MQGRSEGVFVIVNQPIYSMTSTHSQTVKRWLPARQTTTTPSIHFYWIWAAVFFFSWLPSSTTHTGHSKQKIHTIDRPMSPQLLFPNSHWGQITSALPFHPVTPAEQSYLPPLLCPTSLVPQSLRDRIAERGQGAGERDMGQGTRQKYEEPFSEASSHDKVVYLTRGL